MKKCFRFCKKRRPSSSCFKLLSSFGVQTPYPTEGYEIRSKDLGKIHKAALRGDVEKVQQLLQLGKSTVNELDKVKRTPLHLACANGYPDVVSLLIERKCELNLLDNDSRTPLMKAIECQQEECATILLEHGADPNLKDNKNNNALHYIASGQSKFMAEKLIKHNIDIEAKNQEGLTPLLLAITTMNTEMADFLLKNGANVNALDNCKRTALMIAVSVESIDLVTLLLQNNADYTLQDIDGWTAETYAEQHGYPLHIYNKQIEEQRECHNSCPPQISYAEKPCCSGFALGVSSPDKKAKESYAEDYIKSLSDNPGPANHLPRTNIELDFDTEVKEKKQKHQYNETLKRKDGKNLTKKRRAGKQLFSMEINQHDKDEGNKIPGEEIPTTSISSKGNLVPVHDVLKGKNVKKPKNEKWISKDSRTNPCEKVNSPSGILLHSHDDSTSETDLDELRFAKITVNENKDEVEMGTDTLDSFTLVTDTEDFSASNYIQGASCLWEGQNRVLASELSVKRKNSRKVRFASKVLAFENTENRALQETFSESRITESQQKHQKVKCESRFAKITVTGNKDKVDMGTDTLDDLTLDTDSCLWEDQNRVLEAQLTVNFKKSQQIKLTRDVTILENTGTYRLQETFSKSSITESQQKHQKVQCESRFAKIPVIGNNKDEVEMDKDTRDDLTQAHDTDTLLKSDLPVKYKKSQWKQLGRRVRRLENSIRGLQEKLERRKTKSPLRHQKVKCDRELYGDRLKSEKQNREKLQTEINYPKYPTCASSATFHQESQAIKLNFQQARDQWLLLKNQLIEKIDKLSIQLSKVEKEKNQLREALKMTTLILEETQRKLKKNKDKIKELKYKNHILKKKSNRSFFTKKSRKELTQMPREIHVLQQPFEDAQNEGAFKIQVSDDIQVKFNDRSNTLTANIKKQDHVEKERKKKKEEVSADEYLHIMEQIYKNERAREESTIRKFQQVLRDSKNEPSMNSQPLTSRHHSVLEWKKKLKEELDKKKRKLQELQEKNKHLQQCINELEDYIQKHKVKCVTLEDSVKHQPNEKEKKRENIFNYTLTQREEKDNFNDEMEYQLKGLKTELCKMKILNEKYVGALEIQDMESRWRRGDMSLSELFLEPLRTTEDQTAEMAWQEIIHEDFG